MCSKASSSNKSRIIHGVVYEICSNCHKPIRGTGRTLGGTAVWVTKNFVKDKKIVEFSDQWRQLCEAVGFKTLHEHRALLVRKNGSSYTMDGGIVEHTKSSKSFFRRLSESKGSPKIDFESVWCMVKLPPDCHLDEV